MALVVAQVAEPATAGPRLELHRHRLAVRHLPLGADLIENGGKDNLDGRVDLLIAREFERADFFLVGDRWHDYFSCLGFCWDGDCSRAIFSARALMRSS